MDIVEILKFCQAIEKSFTELANEFEIAAGGICQTKS